MAHGSPLKLFQMKLLCQQESVSLFTFWGLISRELLRVPSEVCAGRLSRGGARDVDQTNRRGNPQQLPNAGHV